MGAAGGRSTGSDLSDPYPPPVSTRFSSSGLGGGPPVDSSYRTDVVYPEYSIADLLSSVSSSRSWPGSGNGGGGGGVTAEFQPPAVPSRAAWTSAGTVPPPAPPASDSAVGHVLEHFGQTVRPDPQATMTSMERTIAALSASVEADEKRVEEWGHAVKEASRQLVAVKSQMEALFRSNQDRDATISTVTGDVTALGRQVRNVDTSLVDVRADVAALSSALSKQKDAVQVRRRGMGTAWPCGRCKH